MTVTVTEKIESRRLTATRDGKTSTMDIILNVKGTDNELTAKNAADNNTPAVYGVGSPQFYKQSVTVEVIGHELWLATVHYDTSAPEPLSANDSIEFSTTGGTQNITQSLATVASYPSGAPNYQGAIGVSESGVAGADIVVPVLTRAETHFFAELSPAYELTLLDLTSTVNASTFRGFNAGEVLFLGADVRKQDNRHDTPWAVTYQFAVQRNRSSFSVGSIAVAEKRGWDYMWIRYAQVDDSETNSLLRVPESVHIERVYEYGNFALLGIGT